MKLNKTSFILLLLLVCNVTLSIAQMNDVLAKNRSGSFDLKGKFYFKKANYMSKGAKRSTELTLPFSADLYSDFQEKDLICSVSDFTVLGETRLFGGIYLYLLNFRDEGLGKVYACTFRDSIMIDSLLVGKYSDDITLMQFRVLRRASALKSFDIFELLPLEKENHQWGSFKKLIAGRREVKYDLNHQGKFVRTGTIRYYPEVYSRKYLANPYYEIWEGDEVPLERRKNNDLFFRSAFKPHIYNMQDTLDTAPSFIGGNELIQSFISERLQKLTALKSESVERGKVTVRFVIDEGGESVYLTVFSGINKWQNRIAEEVVRQMEWNPGMLNGREVAVWHEQTIEFN